jgi:hypothetical protein
VRTEREKGIALITALLVLFLISAMVVGMSWMVMTDAHLSGNNENREVAFYGAEAGMERMTAEMGNQFAIQGSLTPANITTIEADTPVIPGITYQNALGASTYQITAEAETNATILPPSPYAGMNGLITPYQLTVAAQADNGSEVKLQRTVQLVAIPVFQFGIFSQTDLSFFAGPPFDFGGRVHTNGNLWLAANSGPLYLRDRVTVSGQVIRTNLENGVAVNSGSYGGTVTVADPAELPTTTAYPPSPSYTNSQWRALALTEGSVSGNSTYGAVSTALNNPTWSKTVMPAYQGMLTNGVTPLNLQSTALGGLSSPVNLIRRPLVGELAANPAQFAQRQFSQASLRILIDDYPAGSPGPNGANACHNSEMMSLDTISAGDPIDLATLTTKPISWWPATTTFYPMPTSNAASANYTTYTSSGAKDGYWQTSGKPIITGCIKIDYQPVAGPPFVDVTEEVLGLGFTGRNINPTTAGTLNTLPFLPATGTVVSAETSECGTTSDTTEPSPNAILRITRLRDNPSTAYSGAKNACTFAGTASTDYWPMVLYDAREANSRDNALGNNVYDSASNHPEITAEGVMNYIELDVNNLDRWFTGVIGANGTKADNVGGYSVYFSDRRGNQTDPSVTPPTKLGAFGFNDIVNPADPNGCPNGAMDGGEDLEGDGILRTYGGLPLTEVEQNALGTPTLGIYNLETNLKTTNLVGFVFEKNPNCNPAVVQPSPIYVYQHNQEARENPPVFFRRALKLEYGSTLNLGTTCYGAAPNPPCGLTIAAENPVYIQGEYNDGGVNTGTWGGTNVASSVMADTVTFLSDAWNDVNSFISPYDPNSRPGNTTSYRVAIISGKGVPFAQPAGTAADYGTDGGLHNFLRYIETWSGTLYYKGSLVSFYFNRAGTGLYKCCTTVYNPPTRGYSFDADFSQGPQWLPPRTPKLTSINTIGFTQELLPTQ